MDGHLFLFFNDKLITLITFEKTNMGRVTMNCAFGWPLISLQVIMLIYFYTVLCINYPLISDIAPLHLSILAVLIGLAMASLIQTFRTSPGVVTRDVLEQVKLNLTLDAQKEIEADFEDPDEKLEQAMESSRSLLTIDSLNLALLKRCNLEKNRGKNTEMVTT
jgi:hypothetical protein